MKRQNRLLTLLPLALMVVLGACVPAPGPAAPTISSDGTLRATGPKRITAAILGGEPVTLRTSTGGILGGSNAGIDVLEDLTHAGATRRDDTDTLRPVLAEALPSTENGLWKVFPDGHMETTWTLRNGALWQDGRPFTTQDLLFTLTVCMDKEMPAFGLQGRFDFIDAVSASDDHTITVIWKQPFINANSLFTTQFALPLPQHLLVGTYQENKRGLTDLPYWNREFIGAGPFQVRDWVNGSHMTLTAFDGYILGRPKLDEIVVKFIPDPNAIVANMLAGEIDVNLGRGLSLEQAVQIRDQWRDGRLEVGRVNWMVAFPQFIDPTPIVLLDARFRKALVHAVDRQEMVEALQGGLTQVAHAYFDTSLPQYRELDPFVVKYDFAPSRAVDLIEGTGYVRGPDGSFRDAFGQRPTLEIRTTGATEIQDKAALSIADYWQRIGIGAETLVLGPQRMLDREYRANRPGFELSQISDGEKGLRRAYGSETPLPENNFVKSANTSRYMNPEFDALLDRYFTTVPIRERMQVLGEILHHATDQVTVIPVFWGASPTIANNRLIGVRARQAQEGTEAWNANEWDLR